ncbi:hypothetical protein X727_16795 [Mesorhizobium sp. L103C119B0]|uniref:hypothetical protein n=1 Tax=Mesorhizobium sp. L103C119B0 TaxID=1287085 RepID=UPI0003D0519B|nr:hypothetical protein [Mesorhizobium sp. L103C119B0]ESZ69532.1 hypothetical protein X727_16795 [Mesorhizobium sp. L103C119B0]
MTLENHVAAVRDRFSPLSDGEKEEIAEQVRLMARNVYDQIFSQAKEAGKDHRFSHEAALLRIAAIALTGDEFPDDDLAKQIQMENAPFNINVSNEALIAFQEYLIWTIFDRFFQMEILVEYFSSYRSHIFTRSSTQDNPDGFVYFMLYSGKFGWQKFIEKHC